MRGLSLYRDACGSAHDTPAPVPEPPTSGRRLCAWQTPRTAQTASRQAEAADQDLPFPPFRFPRPSRLSIISLRADQLGIGQAFADNAGRRPQEAQAVG